MLFDHPAPLPVATVRSHSIASFASRVRGARDNGWRWFRPRAVPAIVAIVGMLAVLGAAEYLTRLARRTPVPTTIVTKTEIEVRDLTPSGYQIRIVPLRSEK